MGREEGPGYPKACPLPKHTPFCQIRTWPSVQQAIPDPPSRNEKLQHKKPFPWTKGRVDKQGRIFHTRNVDGKQHIVRLLLKKYFLAEKGNIFTLVAQKRKELHIFQCNHTYFLQKQKCFIKADELSSLC